MAKDKITLLTEALEKVVTELQIMNATMKLNSKIVEQKREAVVKEEPTFDGFLTYHHLTHHDALHNYPFDTLWQMYLEATRLSKYEVITKNKFSRLIHALGYSTKVVKKDSKLVRMIVKNNKV